MSEQDLDYAIPTEEFPQKKRPLSPIVATRLDMATALAFHDELERRGLNRNEVMKAWITAWLAKSSARAQDRQIAA